MPESSVSHKRKRGRRGPNQMKEGAVMYVTKLNAEGCWNLLSGARGNQRGCVVT
jgi:hypothetical protein